MRRRSWGDLRSRTWCHGRGRGEGLQGDSVRLGWERRSRVLLSCREHRPQRQGSMEQRDHAEVGWLCARRTPLPANSSEGSVRGEGTDFATEKGGPAPTG